MSNTDTDKAARNARVRAWYRAHPEAAKDQLRRWRAANPDKVRAQNKRRLEKKRQWAAANPEKRKRAERNWRMKNKSKRNAITAARYARKRALTPKLTFEEKVRVAAFYAEAALLTEMIGVPYHVDHIKPLAKGGLHHPDNMQVLRGVDNQRKGIKIVH